MKVNQDDQEFAPYRSYLIRLRPTKLVGVGDYSVSLQIVATGNRQEFSNFKQFISLIQNPERPNSSISIDSHERKPSY